MFICINFVYSDLQHFFYEDPQKYLYTVIFNISSMKIHKSICQKFKWKTFCLLFVVVHYVSIYILNKTNYFYSRVYNVR